MWIRDLLVSTDRTARIDTTKVSACQGSFGGFETTCFQLDWAASFETTKISYFSCNRSPPVARATPGLRSTVGDI